MASIDPQRFQVRRPKRLFESRSVLLRGWQPMVRLLQFPTGLVADLMASPLARGLFQKAIEKASASNPVGN